MSKCNVCSKKFASHQGLGGHLSGPCGNGKAKPKIKSNGNSTVAWAKARRTNVTMAAVIAVPAAKTIGSEDGKFVMSLRERAAQMRTKAVELESIASRVEALA